MRGYWMRVYEEFVYFCNLSVSLKLFQNKKIKNNNEKNQKCNSEALVSVFSSSGPTCSSRTLPFPYKECHLLPFNLGRTLLQLLMDRTDTAASESRSQKVLPILNTLFLDIHPQEPHHYFVRGSPGHTKLQNTFQWKPQLTARPRARPVRTPSDYSSPVPSSCPISH